MSSMYLPTRSIQGLGIETSIQSLRAQLEHSRSEQKRYQIELNALQSMRSRISASLQELSASYKKQMKFLEQKVRKLQNENKQLKKQNSLYELEVKNFQKSLLQKDSIISTILAKEFFVPVRRIVQQEKKEVLNDQGRQIVQRLNDKDCKEGRQMENVGREKSRGDEEKEIVVERQNETKRQEGVRVNKIESSQPIKQEIRLVEIQQTTRNHVVENTQTRVQKVSEQQKPEHEQKAIQMGKLSPIKALLDKQQTYKQQPEQENIVTVELSSTITNYDPATIITNNHHHHNQDPTNPHTQPLTEQTTPTFPTHHFQSTSPTSIQQPNKPLPPPKKIGPAKPVKPVKKPVVKKPITKYKTLVACTDEPLIEERTKIGEKNDFQQQSSNTYEGQTNFLGGVGIATDYHNQPMVQEQGQDYQKEDVHQSVEQKETLFDIIKDEENTQNQYPQRIDFINPQLNEQHFQNQNISSGSIARSKKSKRQKPRPFEHEFINFSEDIIPITQTTTNPMPSKSFLGTLATTQNPTHITSPQAYPDQQDDHQMHGLVDQSSIQQIDDHSMISNPIFMEDSEIERVQGTDNRRKGSTDGQWRGMNLQVVKLLHPVPSKKMSKKKAKRETVEVMDPASFV